MEPLRNMPKTTQQTMEGVELKHTQTLMQGLENYGLRVRSCLPPVFCTACQEIIFTFVIG